MNKGIMKSENLSIHWNNSILHSTNHYVKLFNTDLRIPIPLLHSLMACILLFHTLQNLYCNIRLISLISKIDFPKNSTVCDHLRMENNTEVLNFRFIRIARSDQSVYT